ncbi:hypothetical protein Pmani_011463 [Petrolisthes manimaculis]|uniref:Protein-tyrosine-phosphatase n=1 Tax=Petrolisthes manimaculis TaxID=1843537 RepID=A0AAE1PZH4_9EUCA|nr:hypothetical protein Pmani_011463 [Petrolisthes manimaculis]
MVTELANGGGIKAEGPLSLLLDLLSKQLKFRYKLVPPIDGTWGVKTTDGNFTGMVGMLQRNEIEIALGPFFISWERTEVLDFSRGLYMDRQTLITPRPQLKGDVTGLIKPFTLQVWMMVLISAVSIMVIMVVLVKGEGYIIGYNPKMVIGQAAVWTLQTLTQESSHWLPRMDSARLLVLTWLLASLVIMTSYSGILTSMLTVPRVTIPIDSLADLVAQSDLPWKLETGAMMFNILADSTKPEYQETLRRMNGTFYGCWASREDLVEGKFAAICDKTAQKKVMSWDFSTTGQCHLYIASETIYFSQMSMAFRINSSYLAGTDRIIQMLVDGGLLDHWLNREMTNATVCLRPLIADLRHTSRSLSLQDYLGPIFFLLADSTYTPFPRLVHCFVLCASLNPIQRHGVTMWGRTLWLTVISCVVYQQLGCHAQSRAGMEEYQSDGGGDLHPPPPPYLSDDIAFNRSVVNQTLHSTPAISARVKHQASYPIPDINILYKFKRNSRAPDELSYITGDTQLTLQTEVLPRHSRSLSFYEPVINLRTTASHVHFSVQAPPGASNNLLYSFRYKVNRKACTFSTYRPRFTSWSQWYDTRPTVVRPIEELAYSTVTFSAKFKNSAWVGPEAVKSVDVGTAVPLLPVESLICEEHQPTSCSVRLETSCYKENGPGLTVSYDLVNDVNKEVYGTWISAPRSRVSAYRSLVLPNDELPPYTWITIRAYPANNAGRNTDFSLMKETRFRTAPTKPGQVRNVNTQEASNSITVSWEKPSDNPIRGELEGYKVNWKSINSRSWEVDWIYYSNTLSYTITGLTNNEVYDIRVSAKNKDVDDYGDDVTTSATPQEGKPSPVKDLMVVNVTQTTATVVWNEPDYPQGKIKQYIVSLVKEPQGNITERIYEFTNLQEGSEYIAGVEVCNQKYCSDPENKEFYTRPAVPQVDGEPGLMYSDSTSVTVRLPVLHNLPGYQWIVLKNITAGEDPDVLNKEFEESLKKAVVDLINETSVLGSSNRKKRSVENPEELRIVARISQREDNLTQKFTVGDNETYDNYENEPLEEGSTYLLVVATERKSGPHSALVASPPIPITAVPYPTVNYLVVGFICLLLLLVLLMVVLALLYYKRHRSKLRTDGNENNLVTCTDGNEKPRVNIVDLNRQEEEPHFPPPTPSNSIVIVAEEEHPNRSEEVLEELSYPEQVIGAVGGEEENEEECIYLNLSTRITQADLEAYLSWAMFSPDTNQEFTNVPYIMPKSCSDGEMAVNRKKNRYKNNLPYNDTRVKLPLVNNEPDTDYINACYVESPRNPKAFIATQGPKDYEMDTIGDFWRMIWCTKCYTIVMIVNLMENGKAKVAKYWPDRNEQIVKYGITIQLISEEVKLGFHVRVFKVTRRKEVREIVQYHYTDWPDHGVPQNPFGLAQMLKLMRSTTSVGPITVHCSAGIGRTGTVILVLYLLEELDAKQYLSPGNALVALRTGRPRLVENSAQYRFGHSLLLEILFGVETSIVCSSYVMELPQLRASDVISNQYMKLKALPKDLNFKFAKKPEFDNLNRNPDILPADSRLVCLHGMVGNTASQYINVVRINGLDCTDAYLAGEHPQEHTVESAWKLVMERRVSVWVHLHIFPHPNPEYPELLSGEGTKNIGMMQLTVGPPRSFQNFTEYTVNIISTTSRIVTPHRMVVLQLHGWPHTQSLPEQPDALLAVLEKAESLLTVNSPMLFTCKDGVTGCGVATALLLARSRAQLIQEVDVYRSVLSVLYDRPQFITSVEQYDFLHTAMQKFITGHSHYGNFGLSQHMNKLTVA